MPNALSKVPLQLCPLIITIQHLRILRRRHASNILHEFHIQNLRPLLQRLGSALGPHEGIRKTVENLHARAAASVSRIGVLNIVRPLLGSVRKALSAGLVGREGRVTAGASEAGVCGTGVRRAGGEDIGVGARKDIGHHGAGGAAHDEDLLGIAGVFVQSVFHHVDDGKGVATLAVGQGGGRVDVPAVAVVGGAGVDEDEAVGVGVGGESGAAVPLLGVSAARMELEGI
jgi:hypothetical protein